ncbi:hypothetical protein FTV88_1250 [Heliorestis convoluta]|uniref:Uncharacterized protein n=1 Tax=Heliorestis convoluta TaxID=356322 RepID=A0A5Q2MXT2_9FIRM|nr:hypothetical protein FTV88_1250 [Heliorestis convoluta]
MFSVSIKPFLLQQLNKRTKKGRVSSPFNHEGNIETFSAVS